MDSDYRNALHASYLLLVDYWQIEMFRKFRINTTRCRARIHKGVIFILGQVGNAPQAPPKFSVYNYTDAENWPHSNKIRRI